MQPSDFVKIYPCDKCNHKFQIVRVDEIIIGKDHIVIKTNNGLKFVDGLAIDVWTSRRFYLRGERTI